jgi:hypothetical protein
LIEGCPHWKEENLLGTRLINTKNQQKNHLFQGEEVCKRPGASDPGQLLLAGKQRKIRAGI